MRKNKMMRAASALLVAVLLTTSTISGTFAKYVTEASGQDEARVAKWGVEVSAFTNELFAKTYAKTEDTSIENTVVADEKVVAPGTTHKDGGLKFVLKGTPEVATRVEIAITNLAGNDVPVEVKLPAKNGYTDYTVATGVATDGKAVYGTFDLASDYYPVKFYLKDSVGTVIKEGTLSEIEAFINEKLENDSFPGDGKNGEYAAGTILDNILGGDGIYTITWEWIFDGDDRADTYLGNVAAGTVTDGDAIINIEFALSIKVTQIN